MTDEALHQHIVNNVIDMLSGNNVRVRVQPGRIGRLIVKSVWNDKRVGVGIDFEDGKITLWPFVGGYPARAIFKDSFGLSIFLADPEAFEKTQALISYYLT